MKTGRLLAVLAATGGFVFIAGLIFPMVSHAKMGGKPSLAKRIADRRAVVERTRQDVYVKPIAAAMQRHDLKEVNRLWTSYDFVGEPEDPMLRLKVARFFIASGKPAKAHAQLERILHPPAGMRTGLEDSGEVKILWVQTAKGKTEKVKSSAPAVPAGG